MATTFNGRWTPNVTVAAIVEADGRYLLVEEEIADGLRLNNPAGHLEAGESLLQAVVREVLEETACDFTPTHLVGVYLAPSSDPSKPSYLRFAFAGSVGAPRPGATLDEGIVRTLWLTPAQIEAERPRHRSPLLWRCIQDHRAGQRHPLSLLHTEGAVAMEQEARQILRGALLEEPATSSDLAAHIRARFAALGDVKLTLPEREPMRMPPTFDADTQTVPASPPKGRGRTKRRA